jgi:hypothetical protein
MGISQAPVSLTIENVDTNAGTLDIKMTNTAGCTYCDDPTYNTKILCEQNGWNNGTGVWMFDANIDETTCESATKNGVYFDGKVGGFQFTLEGITATGTSGNPDGFTVSVGNNIVLGFSLTGANIPPGSATLMTVAFSNPTGGVCFVENDCSSGACTNVISNTVAKSVHTDWGVCSCSNGVVDLGCGCGKTAPDGAGVCCGSEIFDSAGVCCESGIFDCAGTCDGSAVVDCAGACNGTTVIDCAGLCGGTTLLTYCDGCTSGVFDCAGTCDGILVVDCAGTCDGSAVVDCAGTCDGSAVVDDCTTPVCSGGTTGLVANASCTDCNSEINGSAVVDCTGECGGTATDHNGPTAGCGEMAISQIGSNLPREFSISQNFPNPFNPITSIIFDVAEMDEVSLVVYDLTGKEVITLVSGTYTPGTYNVEWNAVNNAGDGIVSGMYIYRFISSEKAITRKMLYLK